MKNNFGYIKDILEHIEYIESFISGVTEKEFYNNKEKEFAVSRSFEVIGEASKKIDPDFRKKFPTVPWKKMAAFRDILVHDYDRVIAQILWNTAKNEVPALKLKILQILEDES